MTVAELIEELKARDQNSTVHFVLNPTLILTVLASYVDEPGTLTIELGEE